MTTLHNGRNTGLVLCIATLLSLILLIITPGISSFFNLTEVNAEDDFCTNYFSRFASPSEGYVRYKEDACGFTIDYPSGWTIDKSHNSDYNLTRTYTVIFTDKSSTSVAVSQSMGLTNDNSLVLSFQDIKNAIASHDTSIRDISNIPNIFDFQSSEFGDGNYIDFRPSITATTVSDLGFMKVKKDMFATIAYPWGCCWPQHAPTLFVITTQQAENNEKASVLQHMIDSMHVMNQS